MKKWGKKIIDYFANPCPTLFDLCVCFGILGIGFIRPALRGFYLEFYTMFLVIVGFNYKQKRHFNNGASLALISLISLICLFKYTYAPHYNVRNISFQYLNFYMLHEGFGYIFFACLLFYIVTTKATNLRFLLFTIPIVIWKAWLPKMIYHGQMTPILALGVGFFAYLLYKKQFKWATFIALVALDFMVFNRKWVIMKFTCRPHVWWDLILRIKEHPFVGSGFNKLLVPDNLIVVKTWGSTWLYRHNDFLSLMAYIGAFAIIPIVMFIRELFIRFKKTWFVAPLVAFCALCLFQITFIYADRVIVILLSLSWMFIES